MKVMRLNAVTELNYLWKVKAVGDPYVKPEVEPSDSPPGMHLVITTYTDATRIVDLWEAGMMCL